MKYRWMISVMAFLLFFLIGAWAVLLVYHRSDYTLTERSFTRRALAVVEESSGLKMPDKSRGLNMLYVGSRGKPYFVAKIGIPSEAEAEIKEQVGLPAYEDFHASGTLSERVTWWNPAKLGIFAERKYMVGNAYVQALLCHENQQVVLFIEWMSM